MTEWYNSTLRWVNTLDPQTTFLILIGALIAGFLFLRGFGSRSKY